MNRRASVIWVRLDVIEPAMLIPVSPIWFSGAARRSMYIVVADIVVPNRESRNVYEKSVPEISACPKIFTKTSRKKAEGGIRSASSNGAFASPSRMNGSGLGIMYSIVERNKQSALNIGSFVVSSCAAVCSCAFRLFFMARCMRILPSAYINIFVRSGIGVVNGAYYLVRKAGYPLASFSNW
jgi:hypothetical protein